jgi:hypothetical protein
MDLQQQPTSPPPIARKLTALDRAALDLGKLDLGKLDQAASDWAEPPKKTLELLRDTERSLRVKTVSTLAPILPTAAAMTLGEASQVADESLQMLAQIDLDEITDADLQPARIAIGLTFTGFGSLMMVFLWLYLSSLHPELGAIDQIGHHWYEYVWFVSLGVTGLAVLAREAMRPEADD